MNAHRGGRGHLGIRVGFSTTSDRSWGAGLDISYLEVGESSFQFLYLQFEGIISLNLPFCVSQPCNKVTERIMEYLSAVREMG